MKQSSTFKTLFTIIVLVGTLFPLNGCTPSAPPPTPTAPPTATTPPTSPSPATNTLKVRVTDFPPQYYRDAAGQWTGLDVELARALIEAAGLTPEFVEVPWSRALQEMEQGSLHVMMNLSQTPERSAFMVWVGPERTTEMVLVVKKGNESLVIKTLDDLVTVADQQNSQFGIQQDAFYSDAFNKRLKDAQFAQWFDPVAEAKLNPDKTSAGRILGFFENKDTVKYQIVHNASYKDLALHSFVLASQSVYFGISKQGVSAENLARLQKAYDQLEQDGAFKKIRAQEWK